MQTVGVLFTAARILQWVCAAIVMGISSYFVAHGPREQHALYWEILSVISVVVFLLASFSCFLFFRNMRKNTWAYYTIFIIDFTFSYLWLTSFIFSAQDYNLNNCRLSAPIGVPCGIKRTIEAFMFLTFITTIFLVLLEGTPLSPFSTCTFGEPTEPEQYDVPATAEHSAL